MLQELIELRKVKSEEENHRTDSKMKLFPKFIFDLFRNLEGKTTDALGKNQIYILSTHYKYQNNNQNLFLHDFELH